MTVQRYCQLKTSTNVTKWFRVVMGSLTPKPVKVQNRKRTANGRSDNTEGVVYDTWEMTVKLRNVPSGTDPDGANYAVLADLKAWFRYNNPNGSPSNRFTFTPHDDTDGPYTVELVGGELPQEFMTPIVVGTEAWYLVPLAMESVS